MAVYYLDSSALCKRYVAEKGASWMRALFDPTLHRLFVVRIAQVEFASALARREREGQMSPTSHATALKLFAHHLSHQLSVVEVDASLCDHAATLTKTRSLRAYDSLQLAGALKVRALLVAAGAASPVFLSSDDELLLAAQAEGLSVENPEDH